MNNKYSTAIDNMISLNQDANWVAQLVNSSVKQESSFQPLEIVSTSISKQLKCLLRCKCE